MKSYKQMCDSTKEIAKELYDAIKRGGGGIIEIVDKVEKGNQNAVTSNAVAKSIPEDFPEVVDEVKKGNKNAVTSNAVYTTCNGILSNIPKVTSEIKKGNLDVPTSDAVASYIPEMPGVVDIVEKGNSNAVTSNAVANAIPEIEGAVDIVEKNNMNAVTSNAVAKAIPEDFPKVVDTVEKGNKNAVTSNAVAINTPKVVDVIEEGNQNAISSNRVYQSSIELVDDIKDVRQEIPKTTNKIETGNINVPTSDAVAKAIPEGSMTIDKVEEGNMNAVSSNAVYKYTPQKTKQVEKGNSNVPTSDAVARAIPEISGAVDIVEEGNMNAVTSNAVSKAIPEDFPDIIDKVEKGNKNAVTSNAVAEAIPEISGVVDVVEEGNKNAVSSDAVYNAIQNTRVNVTVKVIENKTEENIPKATVNIDGYELETNVYGEATFKNITIGTHILTVKHDDYDDFVQGITVKKDVTEFTVKLFPYAKDDAQLVITLKDAITNKEISDAVVKIGKYVTTTDDEGKCTINFLAYTTHQLIITRAGYEQLTDTVTLEDEITYYTGKMVPNQSKDTIRVTGIVLDGQGVLSDVAVSSITTLEPSTSDQYGKYTLDIPKSELKPGLAWPITLEKNYYEPLTFNVEIESDKTCYEIENKTLELSEYQPINSAVEGIVQYTEHDTKYPASSLSLTLHNTHSDISTKIVTGGIGEFEKENIGSGGYDVIVPQNTKYKAETIENAFFLRPNEALSDVVINLRLVTHTFDLKVVYKEDMSPVQNCKVEIYTNQDEIVASEYTNQLGKLYFYVSNELTCPLHAKIYITDEDVRIAQLGSAQGTSAKVEV